LSANTKCSGGKRRCGSSTPRTWSAATDSPIGNPIRAITGPERLHEIRAMLPAAPARDKQSQPARAARFGLPLRNPDELTVAHSRKSRRATGLSLPPGHAGSGTEPRPAATLPLALCHARDPSASSSRSAFRRSAAEPDPRSIDARTEVHLCLATRVPDARARSRLLRRGAVVTRWSSALMAARAGSHRRDQRDRDERRAADSGPRRPARGREAGLRGRAQPQPAAK